MPGGSDSFRVKNDPGFRLAVRLPQDLLSERIIRVDLNREQLLAIEQLDQQRKLRPGKIAHQFRAAFVPQIDERAAGVLSFGNL